MNLSYTRLDPATVLELTPVMRETFDDDTRRFLRKEQGGPPGYDDGSFLTRWGIESDAEAWAIRLEDQPVGAYIAFWNRGGRSTLGNIFIHPSAQNRGIGQRVWKHIEETCPCTSWMLETPDWATRNHHFYEKCGFRRSGQQKDQVVFLKEL